MSDKTEINQEISSQMRTPPPPPPSDSLSPVLVDSTKKPHKHGSMKNRLISTQKDANASIVVIVMTTKHSDGDKY